MLTVAEARLALSTSLTVTALSTVTAQLSSVKALVPTEVVTTGAVVDRGHVDGDRVGGRIQVHRCPLAVPPSSCTWKVKLA